MCVIKGRRLTKLLLISLIVCIGLTSAVTVFADSGDDFYYSYDFEDCNLTEWVNSTSYMPDANWVYRQGGGAPIAIKDDQGKGRSIRIGKWNSLELNFPENISAGVLKISFDIMATAPDIYSSIKFCSQKVTMDNVNSLINDDTKAIHVVDLVKSGVGGIADAGGVRTRLTGLAEVASSAGCFTYGEWARVDIITDFTGNVPVWKFYVDDVEMAELSSDKLTDVRCFMVCSEPNDTTGSTYFDNFRVSRTSSGMNLGAVTAPNSEKVDKNNGSLKVMLTDNVEPNTLIEDNVSITHKASGALVENFHISDVDENSFTVNFEGEIPSGRHELILTDKVKGVITGLSMITPLEFRTKTEYIDGIARPEIEEIKLYNTRNDELKGTFVTSLTSKAVLYFNTAVDVESVEEVLDITYNGERINSELIKLEETSAEGASVVSIEFIKLLEGSSDYVISLSAGVSAKENAEVKSTDGLSRSFKTMDDCGIVIFDEEFSGNKTTYSFKIAKNSASEVKYTVAVCGYNVENITVEDKTEEYLKLIGMGYAPVKLSKTDRGVYEYSFNTNVSAEDCEEIKKFVWSYPSLKKMEPNSAGVIPSV